VRRVPPLMAQGQFLWRPGADHLRLVVVGAPGSVLGGRLISPSRLHLTRVLRNLRARVHESAGREKGRRGVVEVSF
jgi:hypothetical protein